MSGPEGPCGTPAELALTKAGVVLGRAPGPGASWRSPWTGPTALWWSTTSATALPSSTPRTSCCRFGRLVWNTAKGEHQVPPPSCPAALKAGRGTALVSRSTSVISNFSAGQTRTGLGTRVKLLLFQGVGCSRVPDGEQAGPVSRPAGPRRRRPPPGSGEPLPLPGGVGGREPPGHLRPLHPAHPAGDGAAEASSRQTALQRLQVHGQTHQQRLW